ncbi:MAG: 30S ribosomal protein S13 [bacterium]|nr:30S ribosomal protein S13 [bacterium]
MAVRIAGITLPNKRLEISLGYVYGIGQPLARRICAKLGIDKNTRPESLKPDEVNRLREEIEKKYRVEGELRREIAANIKRLKDIVCYRGTRHMKHLPSRGQRTKTNTRTVRGNIRKTMGSGRKASAEKT